MKKFSLVLMILGSIIFLTACGSSAAKTTNKIKIGASPTPHAEILEHIKPELKKEGIPDARSIILQLCSLRSYTFMICLSSI